MLNAMTVDLEDWYHSIQSIPMSQWDAYPSRLETTTDRILEVFAQAGVRATFFVLGHVAQRHPRLIEKIHSQGHEMATHGMSHRLVYRQNPGTFREDLRHSIHLIEDITQEKVVGYRAPYWSITKDSYWATDVLLEEGLQYDSSIYPFHTYMYGIPGAPRYPYVLREKDGNRLMEFPPSTLAVGKTVVPFAGGLYLRALPCWFVRWAIRNTNRKQQPAVVYAHPPELDRNKPVVALPYRERVLHYHNLGTVERKLRALVSEFRFDCLKQMVATSGTGHGQ